MALKFQFIQTILSIMTNEVSEKTSSTVVQKITAAAMWLLEKNQSLTADCSLHSSCRSL